MKDERKQCKKHHESTIGKIIYGFLLFLPLFAIGSACLISTFNMASKEESEIHYKYETNDVNSNQDLVLGRAYHFTFISDSTDAYFTSNDYLDLLFFNIDLYDLSNYQPSLTDYLSNNSDSVMTMPLELYLMSSESSLYLPGNGGINYIYEFDFSSSEDSFSFEGDCIFFGGETQNSLGVYVLFSKCENIPIDYVETHNVSAQDVFYNSVDKVQESPLFNWTTNTGIYTVLNNTCNSLGITTTFVPLLLAYWLIISVMYFLYDIVLIILNILHRKIHEVQESI